MLLDPTRYQSGWGVGCFGAWGASDPAPEYINTRDDHTVQALRQLLYQFQGLPNWETVLEGLCTGTQALEDALQQILNFRGLDAAFGDGLDGIGTLAQMGRNGADNTYRIRLMGCALAAASSGTPEEVRLVACALVQGLTPVLLREDNGATVLRAFELEQIDGEWVAAIVARAVPAGTRVLLEYEAPVREGKIFGWDDDNGAGIWAEWGSDPAPAGIWAEASDGGGIL